MFAHIRIYVHDSRDRMPRAFPYFYNPAALQPICFNQFAMTMKGQIVNFPDVAIRSRIRAHISPIFAARLTGLADFELVFYLILTHLVGSKNITNRAIGGLIAPEQIVCAMRSAFRTIVAHTKLKATIMFSTKTHIAVTTRGTGSKLFVRMAAPFAAANYAVSPNFSEVLQGPVIVACLHTGDVEHIGVL
jgi:hypothetical protein